MAFSRTRFPLSCLVCGLSTAFLLSAWSAPARLPGARQEAPAAHAPEEKSAAAQEELSSLLGRATDYCDRLSRAVLNFVCRERIKEWFYGEGEDATPFLGRVLIENHLEENKYVYDYQLFHDGRGHLRESRTLLEDRGKKVDIPDAPLMTHIFKHAYVVMGPLGLLSREHQAHFEYRIAREEKVGGELAVVIETVPKAGVRLDCLFGKVWLRKSDAGILKIEWSPSSMENYEAVEKEAQKFGRKPDIRMVSEYAYEKNGIRFPSRYTVKEFYLGLDGARFERSETVVSYDRYKFFTVETDVKF